MMQQPWRQATRRDCYSCAPMRLDQHLKFQGLVATGGEAKLRIQAGEVRVNSATIRV